MARSNINRTAARLAGVVVVMGALAWASIPLYSWFCQLTGFGGTTGVAERAPAETLDRIVKVRFDAGTDRDMPWQFKPVVRTMELRVGETALAFFAAYNPTDRPVAGQASYNVTPYAAGGYFQKIECFCFTEQVLAPGERVEMPVTFFIDPDIVNDPEARYVHTITLSYTFHEIDLPEGHAALDQGPGASLN